MMRYLSFFILLSFFLPFSAISSIEEGQKIIDKAVYIVQSETSGGIKLSMHQKVQPSISQLTGEYPRFILDFKETVYRTPNKIDVVENPLVRSLRFGLHKEPPKTRMVIDLVGDCKIEKPIITEHDDGFFIQLSCEGALIEEKDKDIIKDNHTKKPTDIILPVPKASILEKPQVVETKIQKVTSQEAIAHFIRKQLETTEEPVPLTDVVIEEPVDILILEQNEKAIVESGVEGEVVQEEEQTVELFEISYNRFEEKDEELVLFYLNDFSPPELSALENDKLQVICEFSNVALSKDVEKQIKADGKYVVSITATEETDTQKVRVVLDLSVDHDYDLQQIFYKNDNVFSLIITGQAIGSN